MYFMSLYKYVQERNVCIHSVNKKGSHFCQFLCESSMLIVDCLTEKGA